MDGPELDVGERRLDQKRHASDFVMEEGFQCGHAGLTHDEARHSFISYHVALHRSIGDAALQAGNSEAIVKRHYLNTHTQDENSAFFRTIPDPKRRRAILAALPKTKPVRHLKVV